MTPPPVPSPELLFEWNASGSPNSFASQSITICEYQAASALADSHMLQIAITRLDHMQSSLDTSIWSVAQKVIEIYSFRRAFER